NWREIVAPLGARYFPKADHVGVQYPPGTGLMLALFPEKRSLHGLNRIVLLCFVITGGLALVFVGIKHAWISAGFVALAIDLGLDMLGAIRNTSFSINAMLPLLLLALVFLFISSVLTAAEKPRLAWGASLCSGLLLGFAILIRVPVVLLIPGCLVLIWPRRRLPRLKDDVIAFALGVFCTGIVPLLLHQHHVTGSWYLPTYGGGDTSYPSLDVNLLKSNLNFYFGNERGGEHAVGLYILLAGLVGLIILRRALSARYRLRLKRIVLATVTLWIVPTAYFVTHVIFTSYYLIPSTFGAALFIGVAACTTEIQSSDASDARPRRHWLRWCCLALALLPALVALERAWSSRSVPDAAAEEIYTDLVLPAELADQRAWVWSEALSGTLFYYYGKPGYKSAWTDPATRALAYRFVFDRGEPQYIIQDSSKGAELFEEIAKLGGILEKHGVLDGYPYYLIRWPQAGPAKI
ncbi:MAG TPA: hypothetical protein VJT50_12645, partial [Pyrinomonadaceae bacterium]|nr:hypothetical protein [Pyrinomonadaceae bacterium]